MCMCIPKKLLLRLSRKQKQVKHPGGTDGIEENVAVTLFCLTKGPLK